jgi:hypothetical protein
MKGTNPKSWTIENWQPAQMTTERQWWQSWKWKMAMAERANCQTRTSDDAKLFLHNIIFYKQIISVGSAAHQKETE